MKRIYLSVPHMGEREESYVRQAFATNWLSSVGPNLDAFEAAFSARMNGLPCVALDTPYHRGVITHGETGFLCRDEHAIVQCIAELIDSPLLRRRIGQAAREEARERFSALKFRDALFAAYELPIKTMTGIDGSAKDRDAP